MRKCIRHTQKKLINELTIHFFKITKLNESFFIRFVDLNFLFAVKNGINSPSSFNKSVILFVAIMSLPVPSAEKRGKRRRIRLNLYRLY